MEKERSNFLIKVAASLIAIVGVIGQAAILFYKMVNSHPYKMAVLRDFYWFIQYIGVVYSIAVTVLIYWVCFRGKFTHRIIICNLLFPLLFSYFFVTSHLIILVSNPSMLINNFFGDFSPYHCICDFVSRCLCLAFVGSIVSAFCELSLFGVSKVVDSFRGFKFFKQFILLPSNKRCSGLGKSAR